MECEKQKELLPQAGRENFPESRTATAVGPTDSGGGRSTLLKVEGDIGEGIFSGDIGRSRTNRRNQDASGEAAASNEKQTFDDLRSIIRSMKTAISRQKNISMEVKNGLFKLEECIELLAWSRRADTVGDDRIDSAERRQNRQVSPASTECGEKAMKASKNRLMEKTKVAKHTKQSQKSASNASGENEGPQNIGTQEEWTKVRSGRKSRSSLASRAREQPLEGATSESARTKRKKRKRKRRRKPALEAVLISPAEGQTYANVLADLRRKIKPEETGVRVKNLRPTVSGKILVELAPGNHSSNNFCEAVKDVVGSRAKVSALVPKSTLEIRDLDSTVTKEEVEEVLNKELPHVQGLSVRVMPSNSLQRKAALVTLNSNDANKLLAKSKIRIGWLFCRIRMRLHVKRCYKCLGFGHFAAACTRIDRSTCCYRCGCPGHNAVNCSSPMQCVLCKESGLTGEELAHRSGSGRCKAFQVELEKARRTALS